MVLIENKDTLTQIVQTPPPPPAPNIPKKCNRLNDTVSAYHQERNYQQEAEVSIAQKPAHRRQAPQEKIKGNHSKHAIAIEIPFRDGRLKHFFVKSEQMGFK
jgi:hypothetical protein